MRELSDLRRQVLQRGLREFDQALRARRFRRRAMLVCAAALLAGAGSLLITQGASAPGTRLPQYVQIITDDPQLAAELALANACERFERADGRLVVVECTLPPSASPSW